MEYKVASLTKRFGLQNRIIFRPATDKVEEYFKACDVIVFPSTQAHQARPIYEAAIARKRVVITDFDNTREFLDETNGWLFERGNARMLAQKINMIFAGEVQKKIEENYKRALITNNLQTLPDELKALFKKVFSGEAN